ncbi:MAG: NAD-dependent epimerase/dehydratase family protein [Patescibacteria group bacterium]
MKNFWKNKKVLVTGGAGFIGSHLVEKLVERNAIVTILDNLQNGKKENLDSVKNKVNFIKGDCTDISTALKACNDQDIVMNLAARVGGIEYNRTHQATMLRDNLLIETITLEAAHRAGVERFLVVSSACVYPRNCSVPTPESEGFLDEPEPTNGGYGWGKRMSELLGKYYMEEFGMKVGIARPYNCYGPRDHFDPEHSHVIPALIKRVFDGENPLNVWGSGRQTRAFLYIDDFVEGLMRTIEKYPVADAVNIGTNEEVSIAELVRKIVKLSKKKIKIVFDTTKSDGSPRRNSDNTKAKEKIGFKAKVSLDEGLSKTIAWYKNVYRK